MPKASLKRETESLSSLLSLRRILTTDKTDKELLDEYFKEKYGL